MTTLDNDIRKSGHYSEVNKPNICRWYPLIFVGADIAVGWVSNLKARDLQVLFPGGAHSITSCQLALLVKDEHRVFVNVYGLSQPRKMVVRIN